MFYYTYTIHTTVYYYIIDWLKFYVISGFLDYVLEEWIFRYNKFAAKSAISKLLAVLICYIFYIVWQKFYWENLIEIDPSLYWKKYILHGNMFSMWKKLDPVYVFVIVHSAEVWPVFRSNLTNMRSP